MSSNLQDFQSWGRFPQVSQNVRTLRWRSDLSGPLGAGSFLPYGQGRSYGDCCLNAGGTLLHTRALNRLISFDQELGILRAEAGITLAEILDFIVPKGYFLPVLPGTKFVTLGGAIANDIHGKNHHRAGTFGNHVLNLEVMRSDGQKIFCTPEINSDYFKATIAGLGLTGLILWASIKLKRISSAGIDRESIQFRGLADFFKLSESSDKSHEYTAAWIDCLSTGDNFARGIFFRGNHSEDPVAHKRVREGGWKTVPFALPSWALNRYSVAAFNAVYFHKQRQPQVEDLVHYDPFFFPLDGVQKWNRIYGSQGFAQFQCVLPPETKEPALKEILERVTASGQASFLAVIKDFGKTESPGMLSFPRPGTTLCLDFPMRGRPTLDLMSGLEAMVTQAGGALYPAKDACMQPENFKLYYPRYQEFAKLIDPQFSSSLWRRVMGEER